MGDCRPARWWPVGAADLQAHACTEVGAVHAGSAEAAGGPDEDHGQCSHFLHATDAVHLHLQVRSRKEFAECLQRFVCDQGTSPNLSTTYLVLG